MDELKNTAPDLSKLKKENPFGTPKGYFDDFSARIHTKIELDKQPEQEKKPRIIQLLKPVIGLAASFALIFMLVYVPLKTFTPKETNQVAVVDTSYPDAEFIDVLENIDESSFIALLEDSETMEEFTDEELVLYVSANFTDYEIFEYTDNK